jgi:hypothetical protein
LAYYTRSRFRKTRLPNAGPVVTLLAAARTPTAAAVVEAAVANNGNTVCVFLRLAAEYVFFFAAA